MGLILLYFLGALSLSFLCSVLEAVLLSTPMSYISMRENQGSKTATLMKQYKNNVDRPVGAILSLNTIAHTIGSAGVGAESIKILRRAIFRADIGHPHSLDPRALGDHPQDHRRLLLAISGPAFHQDHPRAHPHHLSPGAALGTDHQGLHPQGQPGLHEPRGGVGHGRCGYHGGHLSRVGEQTDQELHRPVWRQSPSDR